MKREKKDKKDKKEKVKENEVEFDLKKAKMEVLQLGLRGLASDEKEDATVRMLTKLGAKPPKNKAINYKEFLAKKQSEKQNLLKEQEMRKLFGGKLVKRSQIDKKNINHKGGKIQKNQQSVHYNDGMMKIPKNVMKNIKTKLKK